MIPLIVLICILLIFSAAEHLFTCFLAICSLWRNVCLHPSFFFNWLVHLFNIELHELFVYFGDQSLVDLFICKYAAPFCKFSLYFVYGLLSLVAQMVKCLPAMWEARVWSLGWEDPLEKEMATHSSKLAWKIPWVKETGRLQSMCLQRVGHDWATSLSFPCCAISFKFN